MESMSDQSEDDPGQEIDLDQSFDDLILSDVIKEDLLFWCFQFNIKIKQYLIY